MASACFVSVSASQAGRILAGLDLKPHKVRGWLTRRDTPDFWQRASAVCALYLDPRQRTVVLSIDEKTAIAARSRCHPGRPARPGEPARQEFEYRRYGTVSLVAALGVRTGEVLTEVIARNNAAAFTAFLERLDRAIDRSWQVPPSPTDGPPKALGEPHRGPASGPCGSSPRPIPTTPTTRSRPGPCKPACAGATSTPGPDVLAAQRRERARIRSEKGARWGGRPLPAAA